jgi:hypothetical protein
MADQTPTVDKPLAWTTTVPTEPGWYWWRRKADGPLMVVKLTTLGHVYRVGSGYRDRTAEMGGEWCGPIPVPGE